MKNNYKGDLSVPNYFLYKRTRRIKDNVYYQRRSSKPIYFITRSNPRQDLRCVESKTKHTALICEKHPNDTDDVRFTNIKHVQGIKV